jgi:polyisoprenoid-binding protein YceI
VLDPSHTRIGFSARHAMVTNVRGQFDTFEGAAHIDTTDPAASTVRVTIKAGSGEAITSLSARPCST